MNNINIVSTLVFTTALVGCILYGYFMLRIFVRSIKILFKRYAHVESLPIASYKTLAYLVEFFDLLKKKFDQLTEFIRVHKLSTLFYILLAIVAAWPLAPTFLGDTKNIPEEWSTKFAWTTANYYWYAQSPILYSLCALGLVCAMCFACEKIARENKYLNPDKLPPIYQSFIHDAQKLYIVGRDLDFLTKDTIQTKKIKDLGEKCKIICHGDHQARTALDAIYVDLHGSNVKIVVPNKKDKDAESSILGLRGQIKQDENSIWHACFCKKTSSGKYEMLDYRDQYLIGLLLRELKRIYKNGTTPMIKCIALDLGGVYFDGDIEVDFYEKIRTQYNYPIRQDIVGDKLVATDLNLGKISIVQHVQNIIIETSQQNGIPGYPSDFVIPHDIGNEILDLWKDVWYPNENMKILMRDLHDTFGYTICPFSNLDRDNGELYLHRGDFPFADRYYFSYKAAMLKHTDKERFFNYLQKEEEVTARQILLIDDSQENIDMAETLGWNAIRYVNNPDSDINSLVNAMKKIKVLPDDYCLEYAQSQDGDIGTEDTNIIQM